MKNIMMVLTLWAVFWNLENFFDWTSEGPGRSDYEFSAEGKRHWTKSRFYAKSNAIAKTLLEISDSCGEVPSILGFAEVENAFAVKSVLGSAPLHKMNFRYIHYDSPDRRGIDCALCYRGMEKLSCGAAPVLDSAGNVLRTRSLLWAVFRDTSGDTLAVIVNHHPSKVGNSGANGRTLAWARLRDLCDSLEGTGVGRILAMGDFNDDVWKNGGEGTIKYHGRWEKIDGCFYRGMTVGEKVWQGKNLLEKDPRFGGMKPRRTYSGLKYKGGVSDHLPVVFTLQ